jgi:peptidoglycan/LPS O-acetylase OafA/YrhL
MNATQESPNLDFLRSAAVLYVAGFHLLFLFDHRHSPYAARLGFFHSLGQWGVLIFFVHTCLVLMFSLERHRRRYAGGPAYLPFLTRRIFRIFPLSVFTVAVVTGFRLPVGFLAPGGVFERVHLHWTGIASNFLLLQDITHTDSVLVPLWSLPYEMQMYFFLPFLFLLVWRTQRAWPILLIWALAVLAASHDRGLGRLGVPDFILYVPCFLAGVLAYELTRRWRPRLPGYLWPLAVAALTVLFLVQPDKWNGWFCCLLLGVMIPQFQEIANPAMRRASHLIARYSYGIYLMHFICLWLAFQAFGSAPMWAQWMIFLVAVVAFPVATYHLLEKPMIVAGEKVAAALRERLAHPVRAAV